MKKVYDRCCGIDVHKKLIVACFKQGRKLELADWLKQNGCEMIVIGSIGSYWKPPYNIFEVSDLNVMVVNARHMRNVPGRKTDVKDAEWIANLL